MKKFVFLLSFLALVSFSYAQKFGVVDTEKILNQMSEYKEAQKEISKISIQYQKEISGMQQAVDSLKSVFKQEEILLTDEMKEKRLKEIKKKQGAVKDKQRKIFGFEGLIFLKRQELIEPVQDKVYAAIKAVAKKERLQMIFDKAGDLTILYVNNTHDYTDYVLEELGLKEKAGESK